MKQPNLVSKNGLIFFIIDLHERAQVSGEAFVLPEHLVLQNIKFVSFPFLLNPASRTVDPGLNRMIQFGSVSLRFKECQTYVPGNCRGESRSYSMKG
jgi:hypothetical protein